MSWSVQAQKYWVLLQSERIQKSEPARCAGRGAAELYRSGSSGKNRKERCKKVLRSEMDQINLPDPVLSDIRELQKESRELHNQLTEMVQKMRCMKQCKTEQTGEEKKDETV